ncbi:DUF2189 domain-containing protein [Thalassococcus sp. BH17M4-6]|uniref:DUF2189 domain-containing protein n=1 Tax=Thalassococcus sp. BH17M4-6 TaxID=3413148 RepID=UPI003BBC58E3
MPETIGNPLSWTARLLSRSSSHLAASARELGGDADLKPQVQTLEMRDIRDALAAGWEDFKTSRSDVMFIVLVYPVIGLVLFGLGLRLSMIPLLFPLIAGFAILGPIAAVGLYEISRRLEKGHKPRWSDAFGVIESPGFGAILVLGLYLAALFLVWMLVAAQIYGATLGNAPPESLSSFIAEVTGTGAGWTMVVIGCAVGFVFALAALAISVVSFPMLLDRHVGVPVAVATSVQVLRQNPRVVLAWGAVVTAGLIVGVIPLLLGLIVTLPLLGHATWHFYRRAVRFTKV